MEISDTFPAGVVGTTVENLEEAANGENHEHTTMLEFAVTAREEGFQEIALIFEAIAVEEKQHEKRYQDLMANIKSDKVFQRDEEVIWRCRNCGYLYKGTEAPEKCLACDHAKAHFELLGENW